MPRERLSKKRVTDSREVTFTLTGETVTAEVCNTPVHFCWRLKVAGATSIWYSAYSGIATLKSPATGALYAYATDYWAGTLPTETPFLLLQAGEMYVPLS